jgi:tetratricopeptide (TPR) repeat protein
MTQVQAAQYRLARHYLNKLRASSEAVRRGRTSLVYGLNLFDKEWPHIQHWQEWSAQGGLERAPLCKEFPFFGFDVLAIRHTPVDRLKWWDAALDAARQLHDWQAEREILPHMAMSLAALGEMKQAERYARDLLALAEAAQDPLHTGRALYQLGTIIEDQGEYAAAAQLYERCLKIFIELDLDIDTGRALLGLGSVATYLGDYANAYTHFMEYFKLVNQPGKELDLCIALQAVSEALKHMGRYAEAETHLQRCVELSRALNFQWALGQSLVALGVCVAEQDKLEDAVGCLEEGVEVARHHSAKRDLIYGLSSLGYVYCRRGNFGLALDYLQEALNNAHEAGIPRSVCYIQRNLAFVCMAVGHIDAARHALYGSLAIARELMLIPETIKALTCAAAYSHQIGQSEQAASWLGFLADNSDLDTFDYEPVCRQLQAALDAANYQQAFERGKTLSLQNIASDALAMLKGHP